MALETFTLETRPLATRGTWIEVSSQRLLRNLERIRHRVGVFTRIMAVIKANAYGHGLVPVARILQGKVDFLGIGSLKEAALLREQGIAAPLFLFGRILAEEVSLALKTNIILTVSSFEEAKMISSFASEENRRATIHVKVDTGMGRLGIREEEAVSEIERIVRLSWLRVEGIYTHFPAAEKHTDPFTERQLRNFEKIIEALQRRGIAFNFRHAANSAGALRIKSSRLNLARIGLALYGIYPGPAFEKEIFLEPALSLKTRIIFLKRIAAGETVGYGREFMARHNTTIAVLPTGYAHGYPFHLSGKGEVIYRSRRYKIAGRVCMDSMMIDLGPSPEARVGDEVILLGSEGTEQIRAEELAGLANTIPYEIISRLDPTLPRLYQP